MTKKVIKDLETRKEKNKTDKKGQNCEVIKGHEKL